VLFDWDGTLVDSAEVSFACYQEAFASFGIDFDHATYAATYSPNWHHTYVAVGLPRDQWERADRLWLDAYARRRAALLPGARAVLERLLRAGQRLGIVTSGDRSRVARELGEHGLSLAFEALVCGGDTPERKPHPAALQLALRKMQVEPARALYVGDSPEDILMARAAGVASVGIPGGFPNRASLLASQPDRLIEHLDELDVTPE
jgi:HAD superfamily hydrolase (TIGR01549 family)